MPTSPTLYKIPRTTADGNTHAITVETTKPHSATQPTVLFCGGFHSSMLGVKAQFLAELSQQRGWGYTRFDYQGHGQSDGKFEHCSLHDWLGDTVAVIEQINKAPEHQQIILVGSSMGAWLASNVLRQQVSGIAAFVSIAAAPDFTQRLLWPALSQNQKASINRGECISVPNRYDDQHWRISSTLFDSDRDLLLLNDHTSINVDIPVRMLHGTADADIPWEYSQLLLEKFSCAKDATLQLIRGADHRLSDDLSLRHLTAAVDDAVNTAARQYR